MATFSQQTGLLGSGHRTAAAGRPDRLGGQLELNAAITFLVRRALVASEQPVLRTFRNQQEAGHAAVNVISLLLAFPV